MKKILPLLFLGLAAYVPATAQWQKRRDLDKFTRLDNNASQTQAYRNPAYPSNRKNLENSIEHNKFMDLGILAEGRNYDFHISFNARYIYPTYFSKLRPQDITGFILCENTIIRSVSAQNLSRPGRELYLVLNTKDRYGDFNETLEIATTMGTFYVKITGKIVDRSTLSAVTSH